MMRMRFMQVAITVVAASIAVLHSWFPAVTIGAIKVTLIGIAVRP